MPETKIIIAEKKKGYKGRNPRHRKEMKEYKRTRNNNDNHRLRYEAFRDHGRRLTGKADSTQNMIIPQEYNQQEGEKLWQQM